MIVEIAPGVHWLGFAFGGAYRVDSGGGSWVLVDTGPAARATAIRARAGVKPPRAIVLTHGHRGACGGATALANAWGVPVYAHAWELPYLTGRCALPPPDPTVGGLSGLQARYAPDTAANVGPCLQALPEDGSVPGLPEWRWLHTPGHTPGHVALFRETDRTLLAGDALSTVDVESAVCLATLRRELAVPGYAGVCDWPAFRRSAASLAELRPQCIGASNGQPMSGSRLAGELVDFAAEFRAPKYGRYVPEPARYDESGIIYLPPPARDDLPKVVAGTAAAVGLIAAAGYWRRGKGVGCRE